MTTTKKKSHLSGKSGYLCGQAFGGGLGSQLQGVQKSIPTHPYSSVTGSGVPVIAGSKVEGQDFAITNF